MSLVRVAEKCPLLEEIECSYQARPAEFYRYVGNVRPQLKRLRLHVEQWYDYDEIKREMEEEARHQQFGSDEEDEDEESEEESFKDWEARKNKDAFAIAESLHELRLLQMAGNSLTNKGLHAILDGCPHLECLTSPTAPISVWTTNSELDVLGSNTSGYQDNRIMFAALIFMSSERTRVKTTAAFQKTRICICALRGRRMMMVHMATTTGRTTHHPHRPLMTPLVLI
jgi:hypothetical protein